MTSGVGRALAEVGPIDVVPDAGYGSEGTFEETSMTEFRRQFDRRVDFVDDGSAQIS